MLNTQISKAANRCKELDARLPLPESSLEVTEIVAAMGKVNQDPTKCHKFKDYCRKPNAAIVDAFYDETHDKWVDSIGKIISPENSPPTGEDKIKGKNCAYLATWKENILVPIECDRHSYWTICFQQLTP